MAMLAIGARETSAEPTALHRRLSAFNARRLSPATAEAHRQPDHWGDLACPDLERAFVERERALIRARAAEAPTEAAPFVAWFERLRDNGPGQHDPLFSWLAERATLPQMTWFLRQEVAGEAGFEDLVALTQLKMPARAKLELARNYWDEMGRGHAGGMHGPMLERLSRELGIGRAGVVWESLALGNLLVALAVHRAYAFSSIGALGAIELTAPGRAAKVNEGLKRLGIGGEARRYFALHATLDVKHSEAWNREIIGPLVASDARLVRPIAEGALMRLAAGARCFERYRRELGILPR
jgi:hypothetical protein